MKKIIFCIMISLSVIGCSRTQINVVEQTQKSNLTMGMIKSKVIKGQTNQTEILQLFGSPNLMTKNRSDNEVWSYNKMSTRGFYEYGSAIQSTSSSTFDFIVTFNKKDIVVDYSVISNNF
ncbi:MAG: hypothetical protein ACRC6A_02755 [Fusobacteriaceae bacterium]